MAIPFAVAFPSLVGLVAQGLAGLAGLFAAYVSQRVAVVAAYTSVTVAGWIALQALAFGTWTALSASSPPFMREVFAVVMTMVPDNFIPCVNAIVVVRLAVFLWRQQQAWLAVTAQT